MINYKNPGFEELTASEWLVTNGIGGYASSTVSGANTRRYHGLLVAALNPPTSRTVIVSKMEETIILNDGTEQALSSNRFPGVIHPEGFQTLRSFNRKLFPEWQFEAGKAKLSKTLFLPQGVNAVIITYKNIGLEKFDLKIKPLLAHRDYHSLFSEDSYYNYWLEWKKENHAILYAHYGAIPLHFAYSSGTFTEAGEWYKNFEYEKEKYRGLDFVEDCYAPGSLMAALSPGEKVDLIFSLDESIPNLEVEVLRNAETARLENLISAYKDRDEFFKDLILSADQFIVNRNSSGGKTLIAGYHWFTDWGRDTMIAMRGLVIERGEKELAESILETFFQYLNKGMIPNHFPDQGEEPEYNTIDASLWIFVVLYEYYEKFGDLRFVRKHFSKLQEILHAYETGTRYGIKMLPEHLIFGGEGLSQLTWMDAKVGDYVVTPRHGCPVEIQALWYNALKIAEVFAGLIGEPKNIYTEKSDLAKVAFLKYFVHPDGYLYDVVIPGDYVDESIRPNQIYALSLPFDLVEGDLAKNILKTVRDHLLTPFGLRSLNPGNPDFIGHYGGDQWHRDTAYHQGTVWTFLLGEYCLSYLKSESYSAKARKYISELLKPLEHQFYFEGCIHGIPEIFDGQDPQEGRGCVHQAWSVGMILKVLNALFVSVKRKRKKLPLES